MAYQCPVGSLIPSGQPHPDFLKGLEQGFPDEVECYPRRPAGSIFFERVANKK